MLLKRLRTTIAQKSPTWMRQVKHFLSSKGIRPTSFPTSTYFNEKGGWVTQRSTESSYHRNQWIFHVASFRRNTPGALSAGSPITKFICHDTLTIPNQENKSTDLVNCFLDVRTKLTLRNASSIKRVTWSKKSWSPAIFDAPAQTAMIGCMSRSSLQWRYSRRPRPLWRNQVMTLIVLIGDILCVNIAPVSHATGSVE